MGLLFSAEAPPTQPKRPSYDVLCGKSGVLQESLVAFFQAQPKAKVRVHLALHPIYSRP